MRKGGGLRPTSGKVLEAILAILSPRIEGASFLDCYAGTGRMALSALRQGCGKAVLIEADRPTAGRIAEEAAALGFSDRAEVVTGPVESVLRTLASGPFDIIFLDPPYAFDGWPKILSTISTRGLLSPGGVIVAEHFHKAEPAHPDFAPFDRRKYGQTAVTFLAPATPWDKGA
jgi:16S rRNA (guanine(966)-N(2))-methyltransferase RsmD